MNCSPMYWILCTRISIILCFTFIHALKWHERRAAEHAGCRLGSCSCRQVQDRALPLTRVSAMARPQPPALSWCCDRSSRGCRSHPSPGRWGNSGCRCPGRSPCPSGDSAHPPQACAGRAGSIPSTSFPPSRPIAGGPFPALCRLPVAPCSCSAAVAFCAQFTAGATFPKIQFFPLPLEHCILFNPSLVTPAPALFQLDSKNNLFIHTAHAIIS